MNLLLDTCTFLWIVTDAPELSSRARDAFRDPANSIFLSAVSAWEIAVKFALGRLALPAPPEQFVPGQRDAHRMEALPLDEAAVLHLPRLPEWHKDPFDRMLICQAISAGMIILTPDPLILRYPARTLW